MIKKMFPVALSLLLVLTILLSGCGDSKPTDKSSDSNQSVTDSNSSEPSDEKSVENEEADPFFGKYEEPVEFTIAVPTNAATEFPPGDSYENNVWTRAWKEELNIECNVVWEAVDAGGNYETKMNLAIASDQLPDIMRLSNYSQFDRLLNAGKIEDLTEYYEKYAYPFLKQCVEEDGGIALSWGKINGRLMGFTTGGVSYQTTRMTYIRQDWLEASGLPEPKTLEDVLNIARAFKEQNPNNRFGIPLLKKVIGDGFCDIVGISNAVGAYPRMWIEDGSGNLVYGTIQPEMKKALQIYADLYKEGLIDPAFASLDGTAVGEQLTSGKIGVVMGNFWLPSWPLNSLWDQEGVDWNVYPLLKSADFSGPLKVQTDAPRGTMVVVRKGYEHPEVLFKILNHMTAKVSDPEMEETEKFHSDDEYQYHGMTPLYTIWGPRMTNFNSNPNVTNAIDKNDTSYLKTPHDWTQYGKVKKYTDMVNAGEKPDGGTWAAYKFFYGPNSTFGIQNYYFDNDSYLVTKLVGYQTPEMVRQWSNLEQLEEQYVTEIISGLRPVDDFDKFVEDWRRMGGEVVEVEVNNWYNTKK